MQQFKLTDAHIKLLRQMNVGWQGCEAGAPEIDPKRPYGNGDHITDIAEILGIEVSKCPHCDEVLEMSQGQEALQSLHEQTATALQIVLSTGQFIPGRYQADDFSRNWTLIAVDATKDKGE